MTSRPSNVSVIDPIGPAIDRVRDILFRPFDLERWFVIGFCAWLAQLGHGGGNGNGGGSGNKGVKPENLPQEASRLFEQTKDYVTHNASWLIPVAVAVVMVILVVSLLFIWLSSRGRFMFLHCVAQNKSEVKVPWRQYEIHAYSLFLFRIALTVIGFLIFASLIAAGVVLAISGGTFDIHSLPILGGVVLGSIFLIVAVTLGVIAKLTKDFVVPIMYLHTTHCTQAWRMLLDIVSPNKGRIALYIIFQIALAMAIGTIVFMLACVTCGCACCFFWLPYIGTVALLPVHVFTRSYSLYYLAQYGPEFYAFASEPQPSGPMNEIPM